jgi:hypothetical protein
MMRQQLAIPSLDGWPKLKNVVDFIAALRRL